jgi:hypothetical protein
MNAPIENSRGMHTEQLWARHDESTNLYEICCIPFFIYDLWTVPASVDT